MFYSPNATDQRDPIITGNPADQSSRGIIKQYAMFPRWKFWNGSAPGTGSRPTWPTFYGDALADGIGGYAYDPSIQGPYFAQDFCGVGTNEVSKSVNSLSQSQVARVAETALILEARAFEYGFSCVSPISPSPDDATQFFGAAFEGVNFDGRYSYEGVKQMGPVKYRIGTGAIAFADGHAGTFKTSKVFEMITLGSGQQAYKYQYSAE
jgi:hypothetical protein